MVSTHTLSPSGICSHSVKTQYAIY